MSNSMYVYYIFHSEGGCKGEDGTGALYSSYEQFDGEEHVAIIYEGQALKYTMATNNQYTCCSGYCRFENFIVSDNNGHEDEKYEDDDESFVTVFIPYEKMNDYIVSPLKFSILKECTDSGCFELRNLSCDVQVLEWKIREINKKIDKINNTTLIRKNYCVECQTLLDQLNVDLKKLIDGQITEKVLKLRSSQITSYLDKTTNKNYDVSKYDSSFKFRLFSGDSLQQVLDACIKKAQKDFEEGRRTIKQNSAELESLLKDLELYNAKLCDLKI